jgi:hypothetical protein
MVFAKLYPLDEASNPPCRSGGHYWRSDWRICTATRQDYKKSHTDPSKCFSQPITGVYTLEEEVLYSVLYIRVQ